METESDQIEKQDLNTEVEANEKQIAISEKGDKLLEQAIDYLQIVYGTLMVIGAILVVGILINVLRLKTIGLYLIVDLVGLLILVFLQAKMSSFIVAYKAFRETKTQQALENLLAAQKKHYERIFILSLIIVGIPLIGLIIFVATIK